MSSRQVTSALICVLVLCILLILLLDLNDSQDGYPHSESDAMRITRQIKHMSKHSPRHRVHLKLSKYLELFREQMSEAQENDTQNISRALTIEVHKGHSLPKSVLILQKRYHNEHKYKTQSIIMSNTLRMTYDSSPKAGL